MLIDRTARRTHGVLALMVLASCSGDRPDTARADGRSVALPSLAPPAVAPGTAASPAPGLGSSKPRAPLSFTVADLDALRRGMVRETALVLASRQRATIAKTSAERAAAAQAGWEDQTIPAGAAASGLDVERYRALRAAVHEVLQTLDFQGRIAGPLEIDTARAAPELKARLASDAMASLPPASAKALRERLSLLAPVWIRYVELVAVGG